MGDLQNQTESIAFLNQFNLLANQVVEGFISGIHRSPFHGFSSEFAEHKIYNTGEETKNIDWKVYAKTDKLFVKTYDDETNMRCHIIVDNSSSMHYPETDKSQNNFPSNKIQYATLTAASILKLMKKQRDAVGLTIFSNEIEFSTKEQGNERHHKLLIEQLNNVNFSKPKLVKTSIIETLHQIAEKIHKRSMIIVFSDMFINNKENIPELIQALQHLKHNKHKVIIFHVIDKKTEIDFDFGDDSKKFIDLETNEIISLHTEQIKKTYNQNVNLYLNSIKTLCKQYKIEYNLLDTNLKIEKNLVDYLSNKQKLK